MNKMLLIGFIVAAVLVASFVFVSANNATGDAAIQEKTTIAEGPSCGEGACGAGACDGSCGGACGMPTCGCGR